MSSPNPQAAVVFNPTKIARDVLEPEVTAAAAAAGFGETLWFETTKEDAGHQQARDAVAAGVRVVMAAGGDGTVRAVGHVLRGTETALALLPSGTGNVLAFNLDMSRLSLAEAAQVAFSGRTHRIDVGEASLEEVGGTVSQHSFLVAAGLGLDAATMEETRPAAKARVGVLAYAEGGLRAAIKSRRTEIQARVDSRRPFTAKVHSILIANCGQYPPFFVLMPDALIDDGVLDIISVGPRTFVGWLRLWGRVAIDNRIILHQRSSRRGVSWKAWKSSAFETTRGRSITIHPETAMPCQLDGDTFGEVARIRCWVDPQSLIVRVPATSPDAAALGGATGAAA